jgi:Ca-activated chloride channel family protein
MSFQQPLLLLALLAVPLAVAFYLAAERRRRRRERAFAAPATLASVLPRRPGWRRHVPPALGLIALAGLLAALARPQVSVAVPAEQASIVLAMDHSGSMQATDVKPSRLAATVAAGERFLEEVPDAVRVGGVVFDHRAEAVQAPTRDRAALRDALREKMKASGGTATGDALATSLAMLRARQAEGGRRPPAAVVLLSDGATSTGADPVGIAAEARAAGVPVYTVALGTEDGVIEQGGQTIRVAPDPEALAEVARASGGRAFAAEDAGALDEVYERLGSQIGTREEQREITAGFAAAGLLLLAGGLGTGLRRRGRLV